LENFGQFCAESFSQIREEVFTANGTNGERGSSGGGSPRAGLGDGHDVFDALLRDRLDLVGFEELLGEQVGDLELSGESSP
jgi:hypothetical protein